MATTIEKRAAKIAALQKKQAADMAKAEICLAAKSLAAYARMGRWLDVRQLCAEILGHVETVDPQEQGGG